MITKLTSKEFTAFNLRHRIALAMLTLLVFCTSAHAQGAVEQIRKRYAAAKAQVEAMGKDDYHPEEFYQLNVTQFLPATGRHEKKVCLYYDFLDDDEIYPSHRLSLVTSKYNFAAREYYEEYLYDEKGNVSFIYSNPSEVDFDGVGCELRFYFSGNHLIKVLVKNRAPGESTFKETYSGTSVPAAYSDYYKQYVSKAKKHYQLFQTIENSTYL